MFNKLKHYINEKGKRAALFLAAVLLCGMAGRVISRSFAIKTILISRLPRHIIINKRTARYPGGSLILYDLIFAQRSFTEIPLRSDFW